MTLALRLLCRVVQRRIDDGEKLTKVLADYPKLTETEKKALRSAMR